MRPQIAIGQLFLLRFKTDLEPLLSLVVDPLNFFVRKGKNDNPFYSMCSGDHFDCRLKNVERKTPSIIKFKSRTIGPRQ